MWQFSLLIKFKLHVEASNRIKEENIAEVAILVSDLQIQIPPGKTNLSTNYISATFESKHL